ncbi:MAG: response regulator [Treponema sp.]|nr:response regulator [Treponema sp.]
MEKKNSILIVDDDAASLMELTYILRSDYKLYAVKDGVSAFEKAKESLPDLILMDVIMPGMSGFEVLSKLKDHESTKSISVIFITGLSEEGNESEGLAMGAVDYIRKPFNAEIVKLRVSQQIKITNLQRELVNAAVAAEEAANAADAANKSKSKFLANMSHEIRTPMNAIMGVTDILMQFEQLPGEIADGLEMIYASSEMLLGIINDILDFSKVEAGKLNITPASYKVASLINDAVQFNMMRIENRPVKFELHIEETIPADLIGDELRIKQILNNLLSNAFKYTDIGKVTMSVTSESESDDDNIMLVFCIQDTGHGMTQEQLNRLFEEYSRFNENVKRTIEGTGLGLSIMQRLVRLMNGEVYVESELDKGTKVTVRLPQGKAAPGILGPAVVDNLQRLRKSDLTHRKKIKINHEPMPYGKVLIVDDIETNLFVAVRLMRLYKLQIETATNGREAVNKVKSGNVYDVIFMDHMMPEMDGIEAAKHIRDWEVNQSKQVPIVALTANAVAGQADIFLKNGFDAFLSKPIDVRQLDMMLNKFIRDKQTPETIEAANRSKFDTETNDSDNIQPYADSMLMDSFIRDACKAVSLLEELFQNSGFESEEGLRKYITCIHGMKSSLGTIDELELSELAKKLEQAGRNKNISIITEHTPGFINDLRLLLEECKTKQSDRIAGSEDDGLSEDTRNSLLIIKEKAANYDRKGVLDIIASMNKYSKETGMVLETIKEHVIHSEFENAERAVTAYLSKDAV